MRSRIVVIMISKRTETKINTVDRLRQNQDRCDIAISSKIPSLAQVFHINAGNSYWLSLWALSSPLNLKWCEFLDLKIRKSTTQFCWKDDIICNLSAVKMCNICKTDLVQTLASFTLLSNHWKYPALSQISISTLHFPWNRVILVDE